jgi:hypothetical protein
MTVEEARAAISRLIFLSDEYNDAAAFDDLGELFRYGEIGVSGMGDVVCRGAEETAAQFRSTTHVYPQGGARTHHASTNLIIDVDLGAGKAMCRSRYVMLQQADDLPLQVVLAGHNEDAFELVDGEWRWKRRFITVDLAGDLSHHLRPSATPFVE